MVIYIKGPGGVCIGEDSLLSIKGFTEITKQQYDDIKSGKAPAKPLTPAEIAKAKAAEAEAAKAKAAEEAKIKAEAEAAEIAKTE